MTVTPYNSSDSNRTVVYTDGACLGNPGPGGWAWAVPEGNWAYGHKPHTTNNRMELTAVLEALREIDGPVQVISDSSYVVRCFKDKWYLKWQAKNWKNSNKKPVKNRDLWEPLVSLFLTRTDEISWQWVKGHSDDPWNDIADQLAQSAAREQRSRRGPAHTEQYLGIVEITPPIQLSFRNV